MGIYIDPKTNKKYKQKFLSKKDLEKKLGYENVEIGRYGIFVARKK